jgi:quercetin dioxygenase-like cupin family protein
VFLPRQAQPLARDASGWERRILSPVLPGVEFEFMRTTLGPNVDAGVFLPHAAGSREYVAVEKGTLLLTLDGHPYTLNAGDSIYYDGDCLHAFANPTRTPCVYYLAMDVTGDAAGTVHRPAPVIDLSAARQKTGRRKASRR